MQSSDFVGRGAELAELGRLLDTSARAGQDAVALVAGPAGIGKSRLVAEALSPRERPVARGHCPRDAAAPPLWPWRQALRSAGVTAPAAVSAPMPGSGDARLAAAARWAELADMAAALGRAARATEGGLVVLLEDLHWADAASLDLLRQVTASAGEHGLLVLGTYRQPAPEEQAAALAEITRLGARTLRLAPFTEAEIARFVGAAEAARAHRRTGGLPLLVTALGRGADPGDLSTVVSGLLGPLGGEQRAVLEAAAVLGGEPEGDRLDPGTVAAVRGLSVSEVSAALAAAWQAGVLTADGSTAEPAYRFGHDLVREEITRRADPATVRALHRAAAQVLSTTPAAAAQPGRIAAHWRHAGPEHAAAASRWSTAAAELALSRHAFADAARHFADAAHPPGAAALLRLARAEYLAGHYSDALTTCEAAAALAPPAGHVAPTSGGEERAEVLAQAALVVQGVTFPQASDVIARLCRAALAEQGLTQAVRARLLAQLATVTAESGLSPEAVEAAREALALAERCGDPHAELEAARARQMTLPHPDDVPERLRLGELSAARADALQDPLAAVLGHEWRLQSGWLMGRREVVADALAAIEAIAERVPLPVIQWHLLRVRVARGQLEGRFDDVRRWNAGSTALARAGGDETAVAMHYVTCQQLALVRGDAAEMPPEIFAALDGAPRIPLILAQRAQALLLAGRLDDAREAFGELRRLFPVPMTALAWAAVVLPVADLVEAFDDAETADAAFGQLVLFRRYPGAIGGSTAYFTGSVSRELGRLAAVAGRPEQAEELLREAIERNLALGARPYAALAGLDLATLLAERKPEEAAVLADRALAATERLDMPGHAARALALVGRLAARRADADPLTSREREVAHLVVQAWSNRRIADELVLSERTVESHVRSILAKRGCANRAELIRRFPGTGSPADDGRPR
ncbi:ATP-binding protein [Streptacidiphilus rugosus]|uniref:ATP-binding protein n=1 Tax=Streptacidiphilus rugosus TaxID=405783 RepID=UPI00068EFBEA|nr:AAA family ATPase [Streptacidiphilus rugosus]